MQRCCSISKLRGLIIPIPSMYGIFTYIYCNNQTNVGKYTIITWMVRDFLPDISKGVSSAVNFCCLLGRSVRLIGGDKLLVMQLPMDNWMANNWPHGFLDTNPTCPT